MQLALLRGFHQIAGRVAPEWTARRARVLFTQPRRHARRPWEDAVEAKAERVVLDVGFRALVWRPEGTPRGRVLCMHGWEGRATQFGVMANALVAAGFEVVALDGPGHGASPGNQAHPVAFARALLFAERELGRFDHVIGHSMGGAATVLALSWGLHAERAVVLAAPSSIEGVMVRFRAFVGLPDPCAPLLLEEMNRLVGLDPRGLHIAHLAQALRQPALVMHDPTDAEVPFAESEAIAAHWSTATLRAVDGVGHRRILRDDAIVAEIVGFVGAPAQSAVRTYGR